MTKTIEEYKQEKELLINAIDILDTITEEENGEINRTDDDFTYYETWATSDIKKELNSKIGEIEVQIKYLEEDDGSE